MADITLSNLFGISMTTAYLRGKYLNLSLQPMCEAFAETFSLQTSDGDSFFTYFDNNDALNSTNGFGNDTYYDFFEADVNSIINGFPTSFPQNPTPIVVAAHAFLFGYAMFSTTPINEYIKLMGNLLRNVGNHYYGNPGYQVQTNGNIIQPFNDTVIINFLQNHNYTSVINQINESPKNVNAPAVNYNWFDASKLFATPNLQLMKDIESQYYYLSGALIYQSSVPSLSPCVQDKVVITTNTGSFNMIYIRNTPCVDNIDFPFVHPITGVVFNRIFSDGPPTSGYLDSVVLNGYKSFDEAVLESNSWQSNQDILYSYFTDPSGNLVPTYNGQIAFDGEGEYSLPAEYQYAPNISCFSGKGILDRMHIGDNVYRVICTLNPISHICSCISGAMTGFKFANLELDSGTWANNYLYYQTNPVNNVDRVLKRALAIDSNVYLATTSGTTFIPYYEIEDSPPQYSYIGPPQLNGGNTLPTIAFFQTFDNITFGQNATICMYPALGTAGFNNAPTSNDSDRTYTVSPIPLFSGISTEHFLYNNPIQPTIKFYQTIPCNFTGQDDTYRKFFGMGDNFDNNYNFSSYLEQNAGFYYSGFYLQSGNTLVRPIDIIDSYDPYILGSSVPNFLYFTGYNVSGTNVNINKIYGYNSTGGTELYYYIDNRLAPSFAKVPETGWSSFAPFPPNYVTSGFPLISGTMIAENYLPRYYRGPFSDETRLFLYPNAQTATTIYPCKQVGFPVSITFHVQIREETVREIFGNYLIYPDGAVDTTPNYTTILRTNSLGVPTGGPLMTNMFNANDSRLSKKYDFTQFLPTPFQYTSSFGVNLVDNNYSPLVNGILPSGKNNTIYNGNSFPTFNQGIRITGLGNNSSSNQTIYTSTGSSPSSYTKYALSNDTVGLFWGFSTYDTDVTGTYTFPIYNIESGEMVISNELINDFPVIPSNLGLPYANTNGREYVISGGVDPIFMEYVGGRIGGPTVAQQGGYNSAGIIGDAWLGMSYKQYGILISTLEPPSCNGGESPNPVARDYSLDEILCVYNITPTGTIIFTKGMQYAPFGISKIVNNYTPSDLNSFTYEVNNKVKPLNSTYLGTGFAQFDLSKLMPVRNSTGQEWYFNSGIKIGPFDRDTELGMFCGTTGIAFNQLWVNGIQLTEYPGAQCSWDILHGYIVNYPYLDINPVSAFGGRNSNYTILGILAAGNSFDINVYNDSVGASTVGIATTSGFLVTLRAHNNLYESTYDANVQLGDQGWLDSSRWLDPLIGNQYTIKTPNGFNSLAGNNIFTNYTRTGMLYPIPGDDFTGTATTDRFGNIIYPPTSTVENYWRFYAQKNNTFVPISGIREGSRTAFIISNVQIQYGTMPYQSYRLVVPSGNCIISGQMGYYAEAESSIYSAGIELINSTNNDILSQYYNPSYLSPVLQRLPVYTNISGTLTQGNPSIYPMLPAPSILEQRQNISVIKDVQPYVGLLSEPPYNYNKLVWPALSDLETLNPGKTMEGIPPDDGTTFTSSNLIFSASQGQLLPNGNYNPNIVKVYTVVNEYQMYDSLSTDAIINSGKCVTNRRGTQVQLGQNNMSGAVVPQGTTLTLILDGLT